MPLRQLALLVALCGWLAQPLSAMAHDDPIVTVRVLCNGFNVLDMDAVLGEISSSASISVDRPVAGASEIEAWVKEQMDHDLRIEIVDIGSPQRLPDGYTLTWTGRFSRQDWRQAGINSVEVSNSVAIHNGRITQWNAAVAGSDTAASGIAPSARDVNVVITTAPPPAGPPMLLGIPVTLVVALGVLVLAGAWTVNRLARSKR